MLIGQNAYEELEEQRWLSNSKRPVEVRPKKGVSRKTKKIEGKSYGKILSRRGLTKLEKEMAEQSHTPIPASSTEAAQHESWCCSHHQQGDLRLPGAPAETGHYYIGPALGRAATVAACVVCSGGRGRVLSGQQCLSPPPRLRTASIDARNLARTCPQMPCLAATFPDSGQHHPDSG